MKKLSKGERTYQKIVDGAFVCIARDGYHATTFQTIADEVKLSQPLMVRYFGSKEQIFPVVIEHFLALARAQTESALKEIEGKASATEKLKKYIDTSFVIFLSKPQMQKFYMAIYSHSHYDDKIRKINMAIKSGAIQRIVSILNEGISNKEFALSHPPEIVARVIHNTLTGLLLNCVIEGKQTRQDLIKGMQAMIDSWICVYKRK